VVRQQPQAALQVQRLGIVRWEHAGSQPPAAGLHRRHNYE
jgi:hypothetical protein